MTATVVKVGEPAHPWNPVHFDPVALSIESLVGVVEALHSDPSDLPRAASVAVGAAALLAAWGVFVRLNRTVEELEPEGMIEAKREDAKVQ